MNIINGLEISPKLIHPYTQMRYFDYNDKENKYEKHNGFCIGYVNPMNLSYDNLENIIDIGDMFSGHKIDLINKRVLSDNIFQFSINSTFDFFSLDKLNLYVEPLNNNSRGGKRVIFKSNKLSHLFNNAIKNTNDDDICDNFYSTNTVFRLNKFSPSDKKFKSHYDTPYVDKFRKRVSKYTMLIYLTGGYNSDLLKFNNLSISEIQPMTCIIFDQKYEHEGNPYLDCDKIFIRTELIYYEDYINEDNEVAENFNIACYFSINSQDDISLKDYSSELFNIVMKQRQNIKCSVDKIMLIKKISNIVFLTNGNKYYFQNSHDLKLIAMIMLLDYFYGHNCSSILQKIDHCLTDVKISAILIMDDYCSNKSNKNDLQKYMFSSYDIIAKMAKHEDKDDFIVGHQICVDHHEELASVQLSNDISNSRMLLDRLSESFNILFFPDGKMYIKKENIIICNNRIIFNNIDICKSVNFASCQCDNPGHYGYKKDVGISEISDFTGFILPDIPFVEKLNYYELSVDIFKNGFIYKSCDKLVIPRMNKSNYPYHQTSNKNHNMYSYENLITNHMYPNLNYPPNSKDNSSNFHRNYFNSNKSDDSDNFDNSDKSDDDNSDKSDDDNSNDSDNSHHSD